MLPFVQPVIDKYYPADSEVRRIFLHHSRQVADLALAINSRLPHPLYTARVEAAAMLHDIGIVLTDAPGIGCHGTARYLHHGPEGADLLRREGAPEWAARVAERHTGAGIYPEDIDKLGLDLPRDRILYPVTELERLVCYADKFYSKSGTMERKSLERVRASMLRHSPETLERFEKLHAEFGRYL